MIGSILVEVAKEAVKEAISEVAKDVAKKAVYQTMQYSFNKTKQATSPKYENSLAQSLQTRMSAGAKVNLSESAMDTRVEAAAYSACKFFNIPDAELIQGDSIGVYRNCDIFINQDVFEYNLDQFKDMHCMSFEDMTKVWAHECGHRILRLDFFSPWTQELGADFFSGVCSEMLGLPHSSFEEMLGSTKGSLTHPNGELRVQAIQYGREVVRNFQKEGIVATIDNCKEDFVNSKFAKVSYESSSQPQFVAFVNDKAYYYDKAEKAQKNVDYYEKEASKADKDGDFTRDRNLVQKAQSYETEVKDAKRSADTRTKLIDEGSVSNTIDANENSHRKIKTIRDDLAGKKHIETGVPYVEKIVVTDTEENVIGVFPQFESSFDSQLPKDLYQVSDVKQFDECNRQLKEKYDNGPEFVKQFNERQCEDIENGRTPYGYTWHHNEELGKIQLVDYDTHANTRHTGGKSIWGGGSENR